MTRITLDEALIEDVRGAASVGDLLVRVGDHLKRQDRIVARMFRDGIEIAGADFDAALGTPLDQLNQLEIQSERLGPMVLALLRQSREILLEVRALREPIADMLAEGRATEAMQALGNFIRTWAQTLAVAQQAAAALGVDLTRTTPEGGPMGMHLANVTDALRRLKESLTTQDHVLLADQMRYEMDATLDAWQDVLTALIEHAESRSIPVN